MRRNQTDQAGIFITGTDTGVGKTYVACGIASALRSASVDVGVMKPAETGCRVKDGRLVPADSLRLMQAAEVRDPLSLVNPYRFRKPLAPAVAAEWEGKKVGVEKLVKAYSVLSERHEFMIVEGAGGIMVPLSHEALFLDLAALLGLPVVIIARPGLGTINHTLLTVEALRNRGIPMAGIVINYAKNDAHGLAEKTNPSVIERLSGAPITGIVHYGWHNYGQIGRIASFLQTKNPSSLRKRGS